MTGQDGGECCGKAIGEVNPSTPTTLQYELPWPSGYEL